MYNEKPKGLPRAFRGFSPVKFVFLIGSYLRYFIERLGDVGGIAVLVWCVYSFTLLNATFAGESNPLIFALVGGSFMLFIWSDSDMAKAHITRMKIEMNDGK